MSGFIDDMITIILILVLFYHIEVGSREQLEVEVRKIPQVDTGSSSSQQPFITSSGYCMSIMMKRMLVNLSLRKGTVSCGCNAIRSMSSLTDNDSGYGNKHFRVTNTKHPLLISKVEYSERDYGDHTLSLIHI